MAIGIWNNIAMMNANSQYKVNVGKKKKSAEKLSSGYQLNRSADDAAGLQISEQMRKQIRGLNRGTRNAQEGISMVQTGDGALDEVHALLQRMRELSIQALNDTYTEQDRAACQMEFNELQSEIDKITGNTQFNDEDVFYKHTSPYYQCEGNIVWEQSYPHIIGDDNNQLVIEYRVDMEEPPLTVSVMVPAGIYTTKELMDEIDNAIIAQGFEKTGLSVEFTPNRTCNLNLEGGESIDTIGGGLSYLFHKMYQGGSFGALIGTTSFLSENARLKITDENNTLEFQIEEFGKPSKELTITLRDGYYTRDQIIAELNQKLEAEGTDVRATKYGTGVRLEGVNSVVTGFKGNMFKMDGAYTSIFYDNVKYGSVTTSTGNFIGGLVKPVINPSQDLLQSPYEKYKIISGYNDILTFRPNGGTEIQFKLDEGEYTVKEVVDRLNTFFQDNQLELEAEVYKNRSETYQGIKIQSLVEGANSCVGIVEDKSSAYDTLFTTKEYTERIKEATLYNENRKNAIPTVIGGKPFTDNNFQIKKDDNDKFKLCIDGTEYTITLDENTGSGMTPAEVVAAINKQLANGASGYANKIEASMVDNKIVLTAKEGSGITKLSVAKEGTNKGYEELFVNIIQETKYDIQEEYLNNSNNKIETDITIPENGTIEWEEGYRLQLEYNGVTYSTNFTVGEEVDRNKIIEQINAMFPGGSSTAITFNDIDKSGSDIPIQVVMKGNGKTNATRLQGVAYGYYTDNTVEGEVGGQIENKPATVTINKKLPNEIKITDENKNLYIKINGRSYTITLEKRENAYRPEELCQQIQSKINEVCGTTEYGGAIVTLENGCLKLTARLNDSVNGEHMGNESGIAYDSNNGGFLKWLSINNESPAIAESDRELQEKIEIIKGVTDEFKFKYIENGNPEQEITLTLSEGTYNRSDFIDELNAQLQKKAPTIKASLTENNKLVLTTTDKGDATAIHYDTSQEEISGNSKEAIFGELITKTSATGVADADIQEPIEILANENIFRINVNDTVLDVELNPGIYDTRKKFANMLDEKLKEVGVRVELDGNKLKYTTIEKGGNAKLELKYSDSTDVMRAIYGEKTSPGITASFEADKLILQSTPGDGSFKITTLETKTTTTIDEPIVIEGYVSTSYARIDGVDIADPIVIDSYNNTLNFIYKREGQSQNISITIPGAPDGKYYLNGTPNIAAKLQELINAQINPQNDLQVTADANGICIQAVNAGSEYRIESVGGTFYDKVLGESKEITVEVDNEVKNSQGTQTTDPAYTVGRKDVRNNITSIKAGANDTLTMDFKNGKDEYTLTITIPAGAYNGEELKNKINEELALELQRKGLDKQTIQAQLGGVSNNVAGVNVNNVLVFKVSEDVPLTSGECYIDGIRGNAAFSIFYQTDEEMEPAYVKGTKDISDGVNILPGKTELSFSLDGKPYKIQLTEGKYTTEGILAEINSKLQAQGIPMVAEVEEGLLKLRYASFGRHTISDIGGLAKEELFFTKNSNTIPYENVFIQLSSEVEDALVIKKTVMNTNFLKINSLAITKPKYANKALERLDKAIKQVSIARSYFGSEQNRLEYAIANNQNKEENTVSAESDIRDTDMAKEMINYARSSILEEVSQAMMAQSKNITSGILRLLEL